MMDAKGVRNIYSIPVIVNKHNTARVASCQFIIYYRFVMHGNSNIKFIVRNIYVWWGSMHSSFLNITVLDHLLT